MRGNLSPNHLEYIKDLRDALEKDEISPEEVVTIDDQMMTVRQAINLANEGSLTSRAYGSRKTRTE